MWLKSTIIIVLLLYCYLYHLYLWVCSSPYADHLGTQLLTQELGWFIRHLAMVVNQILTQELGWFIMQWPVDIVRCVCGCVCTYVCVCVCVCVYLCVCMYVFGCFVQIQICVLSNNWNLNIFQWNAPPSNYLHHIMSIYSLKPNQPNMLGYQVKPNINIQLKVKLKNYYIKKSNQFIYFVSSTANWHYFVWCRSKHIITTNLHREDSRKAEHIMLVSL